MPKPLDKIDMKIINALSEDCRKSTTQIAKETGTSRPTVIARLKQLSESKTVDFKAKLNLKSIGLKFATIHFKVEKARESKQIVEKLKLCPRVLQLIQWAGKPNYAALIYVEDAETLLSTIDCLESFLGLKIQSYQRVLPLIGESFNLNLSLEKCEKTPCGKECGLCLSYQQDECKGCPTTTKYKGPT
jgi:Lrp/AsnC family leucine-responsive transcriptional regulator